MSNKVIYALLKLKKRESNDAIFDVFAILNAQGYKNGESPERLFGHDRTIFVKDFFINKDYENFWDMVNKKEIVDTTIVITDSKPFLQYKECKLGVDDYGIKRVKHLYNTHWITDNNNQFYNPEAKIFYYLKTNKNVIPLDLNAKKMYEAITLVDGVIQPFNSDSPELKSYDICEDERFISISNKKDEYCMTEKAYKKLSKTESKPIDLMGKDDLKEWLRKLLITSNKNESTIDALIKNLHAYDKEEDEIFQTRLKRCKTIFKETVLSKEELKSFINKPSWKKALEEAKQEMLFSAREEVEKEILHEKENKEAQIDEELKSYRDAKISAIIAKQENQLENLQNKINENEIILLSFEKSINEKNNELKNINSEIQTKTLSLISLTESKVKVIEELEESKKNIIASFRDSLSKIINSTFIKEHNKSFEEFFPIEPTSRDLEEDEDVYKIICTNWNNDKKKDIVSPMASIASMIPNVSYAYTLAHFAGNCHVKIITVEHGWYHFDDFRKEGLVDFWNNALSTPEENFLLVLQNINMIPIQSALQPLIDVINETRISIPWAIKNEYPMNLRIVGTILPTEGNNAPGLPLDQKSYNNFLFIGTPADTLPLNLPKVLSIRPKRHIKFSDVEIDVKRGIDTDGFERYSAY